MLFLTQGRLTLVRTTAVRVRETRSVTWPPENIRTYSR